MIHFVVYNIEVLKGQFRVATCGNKTDGVPWPRVSDQVPMPGNSRVNKDTCFQ